MVPNRTVQPHLVPATGYSDTDDFDKASSVIVNGGLADMASQADSSVFRALLPLFHGIGLTVFWILASRVELAAKACLQPHILQVRKDDLMQSAADSCYFSSRVRSKLPSVTSIYPSTACVVIISCSL